MESVVTVETGGSSSTVGRVTGRSVEVCTPLTVGRVTGRLAEDVFLPILLGQRPQWLAANEVPEGASTYIRLSVKTKIKRCVMSSARFPCTVTRLFSPRRVGNEFIAPALRH